MTTRKVIPIKKITAWSFSRFGDYSQCPAKAKYKHIDRLKEPKNEAMDRGIMVHLLAERFIKGEIPAKVPPELKLFEAKFKHLREMHKKISQSMIVEQQWAMTSDWQETSWQDWANCAVRIKLDCAFHEDDETLVIVDFKTGKFREDKNEEYLAQLELYALAALLFHDHIQVAKPELWYLDQGVIYPSAKDQITYTRADIPRLKKVWEKRVAPMLSDTVFAPRPNNLCRFCHFRKDNSGPCAF
jgi:CRISPR/Cas system-associated exonuclease Cas4 (RecB family)